MEAPVGIKLVSKVGTRCECSTTSRNTAYKWYTLFFTFLIYCSYHLSRKPISVVKSVLKPDNCSVYLEPGIPPSNVSTNYTPIYYNGTVHCGWKPFDREGGNSLLGSLDIAFLFPYAIGMFFSGHIAERMNLRYFLSLGMLLSGLSTAMFGFAYYLNIHSISYFLAAQVIGGFVQSSGWPSVVTCVANWFGKGKRGLIMGIWNSHTSLGNILGSVIAGAFTEDHWGLSFIVPGAIIGGLAILVFFFLVPHPADIGCEIPDQETRHVCRTLNVDESESDTEDPTIQGDRLTNEGVPLISTTPPPPGHAEAISFMGALRIPGVIEFSISLFFAKLVSYVFLYWLPDYIYNTTSYDAELSADLSTVFDFGGITGGIIAGVVSDVSIGRATTCTIMLILAAPMLFIYRVYGNINVAANISLLFITGFLVNGPYALITTAVSADLGTHKSLHGNAKALATVTAIIDGTGSLGAAVGPLLAGLFSGKSWNNVFYMLIAADVLAMLLLVRLVKKETLSLCRRQSRDHDV